MSAPQAKPARTIRKAVLTMVRVAGMLLLVGFFMKVTDWDSVKGVLQNASWSMLGLMFVFYAIGHTLNGLGWRVLVQAGGVRVPFIDMVLHDLVSVFWSTVLPGGLAGEVVKGVRVAENWKNAETVGVALVAARLMGAAMACALTLGLMGMSSFGPSDRTAIGMLMLSGLTVGAGGLIFLRWGPGLARTVLRRLMPLLKPMLERIPPGQAPDLRALGVCGVFMLLSHGAFSLVYACAFSAVHHPATPADALLVYVPAMMAQALPITFGGLGVRELTIMGLGARIGSAEAASAAAILVTAAMFLLVALGGLVELGWAVRGRKAAKPDNQINTP